MEKLISIKGTIKDLSPSIINKGNDIELDPIKF